VLWCCCAELDEAGYCTGFRAVAGSDVAADFAVSLIAMKNVAAYLTVLGLLSVVFLLWLALRLLG
jgi:hypothetical protein